MPQLLPLVLNASAAEYPMPARRDGEHTVGSSFGCAFCGIPAGGWQTRARADGTPACPLCALSLHLERPRIDEEAVLAWLPEVSQQAINVLLRGVHMRLRAMQEDVRHDAPPRIDSPERRVLYTTQAILHQRTPAAASRLGSAAPSDLANVLLRLSPQARAERATLLGGLRLLPLGRIFNGTRDVYPDILDTWQKLAGPDAPSPPIGAH